MKNFTVNIDQRDIPYEGERNLLEVIRKANIELPTFCYYSDISVYGACRLCMVEVEGRGTVPACSTPVVEGMVVRTNTQRLRKMRKIILELMLASHNQSCTTCATSNDCKLQMLAKQLGVRDVRFKQKTDFHPVDYSSDAIVRDPSKCILCGDCVRVCDEIQSVGVLDFADRGADARVVACYDKGMGEIECVNCGQCVKACPVGALTIKSEVDQVFEAIEDESKRVVVQIAPATRVAIGEQFGLDAGVTSTGQMVTAMRMIGFDKVFDTAFGADVTVIEEGNEFLERYTQNKDLPQFTSCCPAWIKFAEQYYPDVLSHLSSCRSPQQMFGSLVKNQLAKEWDMDREDIVVVSIMPCTAKKFEARRPEFAVDGNRDVDYVLTTRELTLMIQEVGIDFASLPPGSFDMPFGFNTGAGVIFGASGGVSEAVLRYAASALGEDGDQTFMQVRGDDGIRVTTVKVGDVNLKLAVVSGLANARKVIDQVRSGEEHYDLIEVMACPGGCVNGGGQPLSRTRDTVAKRSRGLYNNDRMLQLHVSDENPYVQKLYNEDGLTKDLAHRWLHTDYQNRRRVDLGDTLLSEETPDAPLHLNFCFGTSCYVRGAQTLYNDVLSYLEDEGLSDLCEIKASFCGERCKKGPVLTINGEVLEHCTFEKATSTIERLIKKFNIARTQA
ncbi:MAG: [FeFe] hydrogenase, group A [Saccharofermentanales bacterium]|jgi:NADH-quinone oxidoreductase subunit G